MKSSLYCPICASNIWIWSLLRWINKELVKEICTLGWYATPVQIRFVSTLQCNGCAVCSVWKTVCKTQCVIICVLFEIQCAVCLRPRARSCDECTVFLFNSSQAAAEAVSVSVSVQAKVRGEQFKVCSVSASEAELSRSWSMAYCTPVCYYTARYNVHSYCTAYYSVLGTFSSVQWTVCCRAVNQLSQSQLVWKP